MLDISLHFSGSFDSLPVFEFKPGDSHESDAEDRIFRDIFQMFKYSGRVCFSIQWRGQELADLEGASACSLMKGIKSLLRYLETDDEAATLRLALAGPQGASETLFRFSGSGDRVTIERADESAKPIAMERETLRAELEATLIAFVKLTRKLCPNIFRDAAFQGWLR
jgi:hypothetical protein